MSVGKLRSPLKMHGGKSYLARRIVALMPEHRVYIEPFLGGGSVLLNKPPAEREVAGDLDPGLMNFWRHVGCPKSRLFEMAADVDYCEDEFRMACEAAPDLGVYGALCFLVRNRFSRGGLGKSFAWSDRLRGGQPGDVNAWDTIRSQLPAIAARVNRVEFHCVDAVSLIRANDANDALIYCDPPYLHETRTAKKAYAFEMGTDAHRSLLHTLTEAKGTILLSGYRSPLYDYAADLAGWHRIDFDMPNHSGQGKSKQRRTECVWSNRPFAR
jgi:DNA adenine methylase